MLAPVQARLDALSQFVVSKKGKLSALVVDLETNARANVHPDVALNPASNMKVVTAAAALDVLGPSHQFETGVYGAIQSEMPIAVLRGDGDPSLTESALWRLCDALSSYGVNKIGKVLVDQSRFDAQYVPPAFEQQPSEWASFRAPVSAIALERNRVTLNVVPGKAQEPARVWFQPHGVVSVEGTIETRAKGKGQNVQLSLTGGPGQLVAKIGGHIAEGLPRQRFSKRVDDPRLLPGLCFKALLSQRGVQVGDVEAGGSDEKGLIAFHGSDPLHELLSELGKQSDNFYAEMVFKALATANNEGPATFAQAASVTLNWLKSNGAAMEGIRVENGSGLFDANRLSAELLVGVLSRAWVSPRTSNEFVQHLAIGGVDGTLRSRFKPLAEGRRVRAKTGTLHATTALSGYVLRSAPKPPLVFSILVDELPGQHGPLRAKIDEVVLAMADV